MSYEFEEMPKRKKRHLLLKLVLLLLVAAIVGGGAWLGLSAKRVGDLYNQATDSYHAMKANIEKEDYAAAMASAREAATFSSQASAELEGVQWDMASHLPVLGNDVAVARSIGSVSGSLSNQAVLPVLDAWDQLTSDGIMVDGVIDTKKIQDKMNQISELVGTLEEAGKVIDGCNEQLNVLPASHFEQLNSFADELRIAVAQADQSMEGIEKALSLINGFQNLVNGLTGGSTSGA